MSDSLSILYVIEDQLPSIDGRGVVVLKTSKDPDRAFRVLDILVYPKRFIEQSLSVALERKVSVLAAIPASDYWGLSLPVDTALWMDDGEEGWIRLSHGHVFSLNSVMAAGSDDSLTPISSFLTHEQVKGVVCYACDVDAFDRSLQRIREQLTIRYRVLSLSALYEAPRSYEGVWDVITGIQLRAKASVEKSKKQIVLSAFAGLFLFVFLLFSLPWWHFLYVSRHENKMLESAWKRAYPSVAMSAPASVLWAEHFSRTSIMAADHYVPHSDPLGVWAHLNQDWVWLKGMPLSELKYDSGRWRLTWSSGVSGERIEDWRLHLVSLGWRVEKPVAAEGLGLSIAPFWLN
jgi:hypothetical protein